MSPNTKCWICGDPANSQEHLIKASDLKAVFGKPSQDKPLYFTAGDIKNKPVHGLNSNILKSSAGMCARCNNQRTQPHDRAWEILSNSLRKNYSPIVSGAIVRADRVFRIDATKQMLNVYLFFVKQFGCRASADSVPLELTSFASSILENKPHPDLFLRFGQAAWAIKDHTSGVSEMNGLQKDGKCRAASFFYHLSDLAVCVTYNENEDAWRGYPHAWHPSYCRNRFVLTNFMSHSGLPDTP